MPSPRMPRVHSLLRAEISEILQRKLKDPRVSMVTITHVDADPDLHHARVFVSVYGEPDHQRSALQGLRSAAGYIRSELMHVLHLRPMPTLDFRMDESLALGAHTLDILDHLHHEQQEPSRSSEPSG